MREITHTSELLVRPRAPEDLAACVAALAAVHARDGYPVNWPSDAARWLASDGSGTAWVAQWGDRVVGHVALVPPDGGDVSPSLVPAGTEVAVVSRLFVDPAARGHRIGALLLDRAAREARQGGARAVLDVVTTDTAAVALYERLGWEFLAVGQQDWGPGELVDVRCYAAPPA
ncbi:GNAT family N-acetyltransferase [Streptomyces kunmingensis]|uniref:GNAT family N-acetyltransferase n=1 Tax=Streptomyces kunmingensis TaxID=68225 RepID=A0ABU6CQU8_9ACTN|nr:GNAT family N-acetyltransferase [Streptomyces kunmingensis]MEB3966301.1 GNAT family N-acetyltransferase [Streptomyces kunmingensis]